MARFPFASLIVSSGFQEAVPGSAGVSPAQELSIVVLVLVLDDCGAFDGLKSENENENEDENENEVKKKKEERDSGKLLLAGSRPQQSH